MNKKNLIVLGSIFAFLIVAVLSPAARRQGSADALYRELSLSEVSPQKRGMIGEIGEIEASSWINSGAIRECAEWVSRSEYNPQLTVYAARLIAETRFNTELILGAMREGLSSPRDAKYWKELMDIAALRRAGENVLVLARKIASDETLTDDEIDREIEELERAVRNNR